jgi:hypothetical protein
MDSNFTHIRNTLFSPSDLLDPITAILFAGRDIALTVDTSLGDITADLSDYQWQQSVISTLVLYNSAGANDVNLVALLDGTANEQAAALQDALSLTQEGASVIVHIIRYGPGTATVSINGVIIMDSTASSGSAIIQATNLALGLETVDIIAGGGGGGGSFVDLTSDQTITGTKTFLTNPILTGISNSLNAFELIVPTLTQDETIATLSDLPSPANFVDLTSTQTITGLKIFSTNPTLAGILTGGGGTLFLPSSGSNDTVVTTGRNQSITGKKTFSTAPDIQVITNGVGNDITVPAATGVMALVSQIPTNATFVDLTTGGQTITSSKIFTVAPQVPSILNGTGQNLGLPAISGTLALTSQLPTNANFVDLTTAQTITGLKTFNGGAILNANASALVDQSDATKRIEFTVSGNATGAVTTIASTSSVARSLTLPDASGALALFSQIPTNTSFVDLTTAQTIATGLKTFNGGAILRASVSAIADASDATKRIAFTFSGTHATGVVTTIESNSTLARTLALPDASGTLALTSQLPVGGVVDLTTNQSVAGIKTFTSRLVGDLGIQLSSTQSTSTLLGTTLNSPAVTYTDTTGLTSQAQVSDVVLGVKTYTRSTPSTTYTAAATLEIVGPPVAGTNVTITASRALQITAGNLVMLNGSLNLSSGSVNLTSGNLNLTSGNITITSGVLTVTNKLSVDTAGGVTIGGPTTATSTDVAINGRVIWGVATALNSNTSLSSTVGNRSFIPLSSSTTFTVTLPTAIGNDGLQYRFINVGTASVNITTFGSPQNFDGNDAVTTLVLAQNDRSTIMAYNSNWYTF